MLPPSAIEACKDSPLLAAFLSVIGDALDPASGLPSRPRLDVVRLGRLGVMPFLWIMERGDDGLFRFRLTGEETERTWGRNPRGRTLAEILERAQADLLEADLFAALDSRTMRLQSGEVRRGGLHYYTVRRLLVPMCGKDGALRFVIACFERLDVDPAAVLEAGITFVIDRVEVFPLGPGDPAA
ncbi:MAG: hypothetical protein RIB84_28170 [Sneathiellaceae bacterium]